MIINLKKKFVEPLFFGRVLLSNKGITTLLLLNCVFAPYTFYIAEPQNGENKQGQGVIHFIHFKDISFFDSFVDLDKLIYVLGIISL